ncbi:hypothetical protein A6A04_10515 [Paramagnetospirillum marisnigri]|uniref:histidine kinase n=1 Tax=Paramagnetospirillum marisnigri TaxID=1285242 RepID=A0A178MZT0_9PROT|nr:ATP-binding protein [Paramagnetospirillum marisnigri]OAN55984.1 hypothetical protein A6A04_10515 [Paramagnetospirillum marisnigri]
MGEDADLSEVIGRNQDICAREPIRTVGAVQPHGCLIGLDARSLGLVTRSANLDALVGEIRLGEVPSWLGGEVLETCRGLVRQGGGDVVMETTIVGVGQVELRCFLSGREAFCEFEPPWSAEAIRELSGFERVLVYRFDADGNGDVVGESLVGDWTQSFLGLRFPASDIPSQARALYRETRDRWVPTRDYEPVPLVPGSSRQGREFDLGPCSFRSVSPIHRLYQRNIDVDGSMSVSVMRDGRLWGLVIGHHRRPHRVSALVRRQVVAIAQAFSMRLDSQLSRDAKEEFERDMQAYSAMLGKLAAADDFLAALTEGRPSILDLLLGCCGAAVVWEDGPQVRVRGLGAVPPDQDMATLVAWIRGQSSGAIFATDCLPIRYPAYQIHQEMASGVLACFFDDSRRPVLLLFRPEVVRSVAWAGKPEKSEAPDGSFSLPRRSFDRWVEVRHGHSQPWQSWELDIAAIISSTVNHVIIRQRRRIEDLNVEVERFTQALDLSSTTLYHQDRTLRYIWIHNPDIGLGRKAQGKTDWEVFDPELAARVVAVKRQVLDSGQGARVAIPSRPNDPMAEWYDLSVEPLKDEDGYVTGLSCAGVRITERKRAEEALRRNEALLREVQQIAQLGHYVYDVGADHWESSPVLDSILGIGPDFIRDSAHALDLAAAGLDGTVMPLLERLMQGEQDFFDMVFQIRRHDDGRRRWVASVGHLERDESGAPVRVIGSIHDINDRVEAERNLREVHADLDQQAKELARSNAELEQFAYVASHDLRQPLRMVTAYLGLLRKKLGADLDQDARTFMDFATDGARRMDRLIVDLLEYSKLGRNQRPFEPVPLNEVLTECLRYLRLAIEDVGAEVVLADDLPVVLGDRGELLRLFQNLIGNAVKYRAPDRPPRVTVGCRMVKQDWEFHVTDNGIGIAASDFDRAFAVFQRLVSADDYDGTGIGLSACKKIVESHGGRIWIDSELGHGTSMRFSLPDRLASC